MIHDLTGGRWGAVLRPPLEAATCDHARLAVLGIPLAFGLPDVYPWAHPDALADRRARQAWYLDRTFFVARAFVILGSLERACPPPSDATGAHDA